MSVELILFDEMISGFGESVCLMYAFSLFDFKFLEIEDDISFTVLAFLFSTSFIA